MPVSKSAATHCCLIRLRFQLADLAVDLVDLETKIADVAPQLVGGGVHESSPDIEKAAALESGRRE
jgi:hypothetical protein